MANATARTFWDNHTTTFLENLLKNAGYSDEKAEHFLSWYRRKMLSALGPEPTDGIPFFDSFCNDDFSPVELSWNHQRQKSTIRVGIEPISACAGRHQDPFNQLATAALLDGLAAESSVIDLTWYRHFRRSLHVDVGQADNVIDKMADNEHMTTTTVAFDLDPSCETLIPKAYCYPVTKSLQAHRPAGPIICDTILQIDNTQLQLTRQLDIVRAFISDCHDTGDPVKLECVSFDCVEPSKSRIKLYVRTTSTSLRTTTNFFTLGGRLSGPDTFVGVGRLRRLWILLTGLQDLDQQLPLSKHRTAGIIFNFELRPGGQLPVSKVYIPVRHYCQNDMHVAKALEAFFKEEGWNHLAENYAHMVEEVL